MDGGKVEGVGGSQVFIQPWHIHRSHTVGRWLSMAIFFDFNVNDTGRATKMDRQTERFLEIHVCMNNVCSRLHG